MKDFIKTLWKGFQIVSVSIASVLCFVFEIPLYKFLINAKGLSAVGLFAVMVLFFAGGILFIWMLGLADEAYNRKENKHE